MPRLVFPLVAKTDLWDNYGDPRANGRHAGIDMENPWRAPVVAVEDGTIKYWESEPRRLHALPLRPQRHDLPLHPPEQRPHRRATTTRAAASRTSRSPCPNGAKVTAGQQIAWNGDSGDANGNPHLHFEVHPNDGADVNPFKHLQARGEAALRRARRAACSASALRGKLVAAGAGAATLEVDRVRQYPGGRWLDIDPREVELTVPLGTDVAPSLDQLAGATLRALKKPMPRRRVHAEGQRDARGDRRRARRAPARPRRTHAVAAVGRRPSRSN